MCVGVYQCVVQYNGDVSKEATGFGRPAVKAQQPRPLHRSAAFSFLPRVALGHGNCFWQAVRDPRKGVPVP